MSVLPVEDVPGCYLRVSWRTSHRPQGEAVLIVAAHRIIERTVGGVWLHTPEDDDTERTWVQYPASNADNGGKRYAYPLLRQAVYSYQRRKRTLLVETEVRLARIARTLACLEGDGAPDLLEDALSSLRTQVKSLPMHLSFLVSHFEHRCGAPTLPPFVGGRTSS